jgi:hypothetical protein
VKTRPTSLARPNSDWNNCTVVVTTNGAYQFSAASLRHHAADGSFPSIVFPDSVGTASRYIPRPQRSRDRFGIDVGTPPISGRGPAPGQELRAPDLVPAGQAPDRYSNWRPGYPAEVRLGIEEVSVHQGAEHHPRQQVQSAPVVLPRLLGPGRRPGLRWPPTP